VGARHYGEALGAFQPNRDVTEFGERLEVASRPAAKIEDFLSQAGNRSIPRRRRLVAQLACRMQNNSSTLRGKAGCQLKPRVAGVDHLSGRALTRFLIGGLPLDVVGSNSTLVTYTHLGHS
jgi:hypothetical protein